MIVNSFMDKFKQCSNRSDFNYKLFKSYYIDRKIYCSNFIR